jgi:catecholate siderophore receptor
MLPLGALAAGFGFASLALAQTPSDDALPVVRAKARAEPTSKDSYQATQTTAGKGKQELRDTPQSVTVVTEKLMDDKNQDTVKAALHAWRASPSKPARAAASAT